MAVYDGFFDATLNEETGEYDRAYESGDFTGYFANAIGSGVCVHDNPDSFKVRLEGGKVVVSPGYLFIQGYWCRNDADYIIDLPGNGNYAIVAHLNLGKRMIELEARSVAQAYPDSLVLAIASPASAEDTRHNTDLCGVIDTAGELSSKVEWALNYIDNEIENKLAAVEQDINAQAAKLDQKIAEVQAVADSIVPPPVGSIKFSASQDVGEEWLRCDGSFVNEADYPELVAALGKLTPSGDKFQLISDGEIAPQISNGVVYGGRMWVYSYSAKKLYGVDLEGNEAIKEIEITSEDSNFGGMRMPSTQSPICLSIIPHKSGAGAKLFLTQILDNYSMSTLNEQNYFSEISGWNDHFLIFCADFSGAEASIAVERPFSKVSVSINQVTIFNFRAEDYIPYVVSSLEDGVEKYSFLFGYAYGRTSFNSSTFITQTAQAKWADGEGSAALFGFGAYSSLSLSQRGYLDKKASNEMVYVLSAGQNYYAINSRPNSLHTSVTVTAGQDFSERKTATPVNAFGANALLFAFDKNKISRFIVEPPNIDTIPISIAPSAARVFVDAAAYLWGKDIYMIFVGTGIIFSRTLEEGSFGYLDTTSVLGTITQFGYLDYSQDEGTLYLLGQDTANRVKVAKIVLNTLYDYANDGAWLPVIASDGVPAYIKAKEVS